MLNALLQSDVAVGYSPTLAICIFGEDKAKVESCLAAMLNKGLEANWNPVPKAMEYAVMGQAQRVRPILALMSSFASTLQAPFFANSYMGADIS